MEDDGSFSLPENELASLLQEKFDNSKVDEYEDVSLQE